MAIDWSLVVPKPIQYCCPEPSSSASPSSSLSPSLSLKTQQQQLLSQIRANNGTSNNSAELLSVEDRLPAYRLLLSSSTVNLSENGRISFESVISSLGLWPIPIVGHDDAKTFRMANFDFDSGSETAPTNDSLKAYLSQPNQRVIRLDAQRTKVKLGQGVKIPSILIEILLTAIVRIVQHALDDDSDTSGGIGSPDNSNTNNSNKKLSDTGPT